MTATSLAPSSTGCRFRWCNSCDITIGGERSHWSGYKEFYDADLEDFVGAELFGYENDRDGIDPVQVYLAVGRDGIEDDGRAISPSQALALGVTLRDFSCQSEWRDRLVHTVEIDGEVAVSVEFRGVRSCRDGRVRGPRLELSVHGAAPYSLRVRLSPDRANDFGVYLIEQAALADAANRFFGLMSE